MDTTEKKYTYEDSEPMMVNEEVMAFPQGVTIPINLPTTGGYSVEYLKKELTDFAMKLLRPSKPKHTATRIKWREIAISDKVKAMTLGPSELSSDPRNDKELLAEALKEKYQ